MSNLNSLFKPKSIAIVGVSQDPQKLGTILFSNLIDAKYPGKIFPVNPKHKEIHGYKSYSKISSIKEDVDMVCIAIPAPFVKDVIKDAGKKGVKTAVIITAGFKEVGGEGEKLEQDILKEANKFGIRILGPNCLGLITPSERINASFAASNPQEGEIAFLSQSGAFCTAILDLSKLKNVGFSHFVSMGNKADIKENEIFEYWMKDEEVKVIGAYLEEITNGRELIDMYEKQKEPKPLIILKPGRTQQAKKAISSHTGSLAGSIETFRTAINQAGIIEANETNHMFNLMMGFAWSKIPQGSRVAVITNAGGPGIVATDTLIEYGFQMAEISEKSKKEIKKHLPPTASLNNPIDVIGDALAERYKAPIEVLDKDDNVDAILVVLTPQLVTQIEDTAKLIINSTKLSKKPIFAVFLGGKYVADGLQRLWDNKVPGFRYIKNAVEVMSAMYKYGQKMKERKEGCNKRNVLKYLNKGQYFKEMSKHLSDEPIALPDDLAAKMAEEAGIDIPRQILATSFNKAVEFASDKYPVVIKATTDVIAHKTDDKALYLNIYDEKTLKDNYKTLEKLLVSKFKQKHPQILVQEQIISKEELFIGTNRDGNIDVYNKDSIGFGHLIAFGKGGIYTEIYKDINYALTPACQKTIEQALDKTSVSKIIKGARGNDPLAYDKIIEAIKSVQRMVIMYPEIISLDINPILVTETRAVAVDVKIFVGK